MPRDRTSDPLRTTPGTHFGKTLCDPEKNLYGFYGDKLRHCIAGFCESEAAVLSGCWNAGDFGHASAMHETVGSTPIVEVPDPLNAWAKSAAV